MEGKENKLLDYLSGEKNYFKVPVYQRNYDWKIANCRQLLEDLEKIIKEHKSSHFFGSVVSETNTVGIDTTAIIVDGQQRITTISLLLLAMYKLLKEEKIKAQNEDLADDIYRNLLVNKNKKNKLTPYLSLTELDNDSYLRLFEFDSDFIKDSNVTLNYNYLSDEVIKRFSGDKDESLNIDNLYDAMYKLYVIVITLKDGDNPQAIFESLNSTGLDLREGDKVRNYVLMGLDEDIQDNYYNIYWRKIENNTCRNISDFIRIYLTIKLRSIPTEKEVYIIFKKYVERNFIDIESLLKDLLKYSKYFYTITHGDVENTELKACIKRMNRLDYKPVRPYFIEVFKLYNDKVLNEDDLINIYKINESYLLRRFICGKASNSLNKIYRLLNQDIYKYNKNYDDYINKLSHCLIIKTNISSFPDDSEFKKCFYNFNNYSNSNKNIVYILERLENYNTKEIRDLYDGYDNRTYTIEHIMPQRLSKDWKKDLGDNWEKIHKKWLNKIANLTLTGYNSQYSNSSFTTKKKQEHGFQDSGLRMNQEIAKNDKWTEVELEERAQDIIEKALKIWEYPSTTYDKDISDEVSYTLEDDFEKLKLEYFLFKNKKFIEHQWVNLLVTVLKELYKINKHILLRFVNAKDDELLCKYISDSNAKYRQKREIAKDIYVETNTSTSDKVKILRQIFKLYDLDNDDLVFYGKHTD